MTLQVGDAHPALNAPAVAGITRLSAADTVRTASDWPSNWAS
ncbi:hypothetical protein ACNQR9_33835 [Mycolicibacterium peregrinum]